jgi:mRNA interferase RelE/StbE
MFEVVLSPEADAFYKAANPPLAKKLARCFSQLEREPRRHSNIKRLTGEFVGRLRYRIGDWRVIFRIDSPSLRIYVLSIAHRREVYE